MNGQPGELGEGEPREFVTTRWSLIFSAANLGREEQKARDALAELCRTYWRPIFSFVRARGYSIEDAQDLTQDFFVIILKENWLQHADRKRGRFRSFLLRSLQNFLINAAEKPASASKASTTANSGKHMVWVPSSTGSHIGGRWVEVDENGNADTSALNVKRGSAEALRQEQLQRGGGPGSVPGGSTTGP